jgi:hypothetical protein
MQLLVAGSIAASLALVGCHGAPLRSARLAVDDARWTFSTEHYCPVHRVAEQYIDSTPLAPPPIANDPERYALWHAAAQKRAGGQHYILVQGCEEQVMYKCWYDHAGEPCLELRPGMSVVNDAPFR